MQEEIIYRLQVDPGTRTLGELIQDREAALHEIRRLRKEIERLRSAATKDSRHMDKSTVDSYKAGTLINVKQVSELVGISRSTIYKRILDGSFPNPIRVGPRSVRWSVDVIEAWRQAL